MRPVAMAFATHADCVINQLLPFYNLVDISCLKCFFLGEFPMKSRYHEKFQSSMWEMSRHLMAAKHHGYTGRGSRVMHLWWWWWWGGGWRSVHNVCDQSEGNTGGRSVFTGVMVLMMTQLTDSCLSVTQKQHSCWRKSWNLISLQTGEEESVLMKLFVFDRR